MMASTLRLPCSKPPFVRIHGKEGVHELRAAIDTAASLCMVQKRDLIELGYHAYFGPRVANIGEGAEVITPYYKIRAPLVRVKEIELGRLIAKDVPCLGVDIFEDLGVDVILGRSFLENFDLEFDFKDDVVTFHQEEAPTEG
jgi:hypothetical protein